MTPFLYFILLLGTLIFIHELGHFIFAKLMGVRVLTFSIGFGPKILKFIRNGTTYCVSLIPLGGYVKMLGEENDEIPPDERDAAFNYKPVWRRTLIVLAGPVFNLILPFFIFFFLFFSEGTLSPSIIGSVTPEGPAWKAGLRPGDRITSIDGRDVKYWWEVLGYVSKNPQKEMDIAYERDGNLFWTKVTPALVEIKRFKELDMIERLGRIEISPVFVRSVIMVEQGGAADRAGLKNWDLITQIDGADVRRWEDIEKAFKKLREEKPAGSVLKISVKRMKELSSDLKLFDEELSESLEFTMNAEDAANPGISPAEMAIYSVEEGGTAADIGLKKGDLILSLNGQEFNNFQFFIENLSRDPDRKNVLKYRRGDEVMEKEFTLKKVEKKDDFGNVRVYANFGAHNLSLYDLPEEIPNDSRLKYAIIQTVSEVFNAYYMTCLGVFGLFAGKVPLKEIGGPIMIYDVASKTSEMGWGYFFKIMVLLSISLGIINLLPIPVLDGGHLLLFGMEALKRKPLSLRTRQIASYIGLFLIIALMLFAFKNDIERKFGDIIREWFM